MQSKYSVVYCFCGTNLLFTVGHFSNSFQEEGIESLFLQLVLPFSQKYFTKSIKCTSRISFNFSEFWYKKSIIFLLNSSQYHLIFPEILFDKITPIFYFIKCKIWNIRHFFFYEFQKSFNVYKFTNFSIYK